MKLSFLVDVDAELPIAPPTDTEKAARIIEDALTQAMVGIWPRLSITHTKITRAPVGVLDEVLAK